jgi:hypothetical protein
MNLQSSTLKDDESGEPLNIQQRQQIEAYRAAWKEAEHRREPRVWVSRSIFALVDDRDRAHLDGTRASAIRSVTSTATRAPSSAVRTLRSPTCWSRNLPRTRRLPPLILTIDRGWREVGNTALAFVKHFN